MDEATRELERIAQYNHKGALALANGNDRVAHQTFRGLVEAIGALSNRTGGANTSDGGPIQTMLSSSVSVSDLKDERFFIFGEVLLYKVLPESLEPSMFDLCFCSCITLFNMALTYHRRAFHTKSKSLHSTAAKVYEQSLSIANTITERNDDVKKMKVVILNNLAHIRYFELEEVGAAMQGLERMKTIMDGFGNSGRAIFGEGARDEISLNLLITKPPFAAGCA